MTGTDATAHHSAAILNAAYLVRHYHRAHQDAERRAALDRMGRTVYAALAAGVDAEPVLYAVATGLHDRTDPRFHR